MHACVSDPTMPPPPACFRNSYCFKSYNDPNRHMIKNIMTKCNAIFYELRFEVLGISKKMKCREKSGRATFQPGSFFA